MKYVRQFWIILLISAMGEALHVLIPLPVPASVYGLVIMLIALGTHIIRLEQVKEAAEFHRDHAGYVYSGRCRITDSLGHTETGMCADHSDYSDHHSCGNDCDRSCHTGSYSYGQKERTEKIMTQFMSNSLFLAQRSA